MTKEKIIQAITDSFYEKTFQGGETAFHFGIKNDELVRPTTEDFPDLSVITNTKLRAGGVLSIAILGFHIYPQAQSKISYDELAQFIDQPRQ